MVDLVTLAARLEHSREAQQSERPNSDPGNRTRGARHLGRSRWWDFLQGLRLPRVRLLRRWKYDHGGTHFYIDCQLLAERQLIEADRATIHEHTPLRVDFHLPDLRIAAIRQLRLYMHVRVRDANQFGLEHRVVL